MRLRLLISAIVSDWTVRGFALNNHELMALAEAKIQSRKLTCRELQHYMLDDQYNCIPRPLTRKLEEIR